MSYKTPLEEAITKSGLKKSYIAQRVGIRPATLTALISGETKTGPEMITGLKIARLLNTTVENLWGYLIKEE